MVYDREQPCSSTSISVGTTDNLHKKTDSVNPSEHDQAERQVLSGHEDFIDYRMSISLDICQKLLLTLWFPASTLWAESCAAMHRFTEEQLSSQRHLMCIGGLILHPFILLLLFLYIDAQRIIYTKLFFLWQSTRLYTLRSLFLAGTNFSGL